MEGRKVRRPRKMYSAGIKAQAVLSLWSGRRKPSALCREMGVSWGLLSQWQEKAMEGMLMFLEPKYQAEDARNPLLGVRLKELLDRKAQERETAVKTREKPRKPQEQASPAVAEKPAG